MLITFIIALVFFVLIGLSSGFFNRNTKTDYYLASSSVHPALVGLSAVATNNSGYMFIGAIGYTYATGLASIWLMVGWIAGDFAASLFVHSRIRQAAENTGEVSYAGVVSHWVGGDTAKLQKLIAVISLLFLIAYAGAQFIAGSKALNVLLGWPQWVGASISAVLVMLYCFVGGIRASIWTDAAQSCVMIVAMLSLLISTLIAVGGMEAAINAMALHEGFLDVFPSDLPIGGNLGGLLFIAGWVFAGMSVIGQPHIMVRFMTLDKKENIVQAKLWYYAWFTLFYASAIAVGMLCKIALPDAAGFDAELALPTLAKQMLPEVWVGIILAGLFAATMSTADSLVLSSSAAITHDLSPRKIENPFWLKIVTVLVTLLALTWSLLNSQSVFDLVIMAWSGLGSAFAPLLLILCFGMRPSPRACISAIIMGFLVALIWRWVGWHHYVFEGFPGILAGLAVFIAAEITNCVGAKPPKH